MQQRAPDVRVQRMFGTDRLWAFGALTVLWSTYLFVFSELWGSTKDEQVLLTLAISGGLVLLFNTASIIAMIAHYAEDKEHIYGLDIHYLDEMRKARG